VCVSARVCVCVRVCVLAGRNSPKVSSLPNLLYKIGKELMFEMFNASSYVNLFLIPSFRCVCVCVYMCVCVRASKNINSQKTSRYKFFDTK